MTETELFAAVHEYANAAKTGIHAIVDLRFEAAPAAREKLLDVMREYVAALPVEICEPAYAHWLRAKAAVCDAFLAAPDENYDRNIGKAVRELSELEPKP